VTIGTRELEIPAMTAADWLAVLMDDEFEIYDILDLLPDAEEALLESDMELQEIQDVLLDVISTASARKWWIALRLIWVARTHWDVLGGYMIGRGIDPERLSLSAWLTALTFNVVRNMTADNASMFTARLEMPPTPELVKKEADTQEMDAGAFLSMQ
jgi:hypothetical protein